MFAETWYIMLFTTCELQDYELKREIKKKKSN